MCRKVTDNVGTEMSLFDNGQKSCGEIFWGWLRR
jgi:hypothetical protein